MTTTPQKAHLVLADGTHFEGLAIGAPGHTLGEAVFTTGMTGYQEILTDPSYCGQIVTMTAPQIGNTGINDEDHETRTPVLAGFVIRELSNITSSWRATQSLDAYLKQHHIVGIAEIDTRTLTRHIRDHGAQNAIIGTGDIAELHQRVQQAAHMAGQDLTEQVTTKSPYAWTEDLGVWHTSALPNTSNTSNTENTPNTSRHIVAIDFGIKQNILRHLTQLGCRVTVVPATTHADAILALNPDGVFLSNGPGDPAAVTQGIQTVQQLLGKCPLFGICLGHQILALALGCTTYKLKFGHRGLNQPVKDLHTGRVEITTQNHGFVVDMDSMKGKCDVTHVHLNDGTCQGLEHKPSNAFAVQYHPEAAAGPHDSHYLFQRFIDNIDNTKRATAA